MWKYMVNGKTWFHVNFFRYVHNCLKKLHTHREIEKEREQGITMHSVNAKLF